MSPYNLQHRDRLTQEDVQTRASSASLLSIRILSPSISEKANRKPETPKKHPSLPLRAATSSMR